MITKNSARTEFFQKLNDCTFDSPLGNKICRGGQIEVNGCTYKINPETGRYENETNKTLSMKQRIWAFLKETGNVAAELNNVRSMFTDSKNINEFTEKYGEGRDMPYGALNLKPPRTPPYF
jgi:hypothetical protein